jgi:cell division septation protein DedD
MFSIRLRAAENNSPPSSEVMDRDDAGDAADGAAPEGVGTASPALDGLQEFADRTGLTIIEINRPERRVVLWSTAGNISAAFRAAFAHYECAGKVWRSLTGPIYLPAAIAETVEDVSGLNDSLPDWVSSAILSRADRRSAERPPIMSQLLFVVGGALIALGVFLYWAHAFGRPMAAQTGKVAQIAAQRVAVVPSAPTSVPQDAAVPQPPSTAATVRELAKFEVAAWAALDSGRLQEAQDNFLGVLAIDPARDNAMRGLVTVRRKMGADNPQIVRQQIAAYQRAIDRGTVIDEKYALPVLKVLVSAGLAAAQELDVQHGPSAPAPPAAQASVPPPIHPQGPVASRGDVQHPATHPANVPPKAEDHPAAHPAVPPQTRPTAPASPAPTRPAAPAPQNPPVQAAQNALSPTSPTPHLSAVPGPQAPPSNRLYTVRIGPVLDRDRAAAIVKQLSAGGFPQAQTGAQTGYRVVSEPLPRKAAESLMATLAARGFRADVQSLTGDTVQLLFGVFVSQKDAETLSGRIAAAGYDAWIREGTVYTLSVGPYPSASVTAITGIAKAGGPETPVTVDPIP